VVRVVSRRGSVRAKAHVTDAVSERTVLARISHPIDPSTL
jgi:anaerobic selenocysteine-containing dehydrogenase